MHHQHDVWQAGDAFSRLLLAPGSLFALRFDGTHEKSLRPPGPSLDRGAESEKITAK